MNVETTKKMVRLEIQQQLARYAACVRETGASEVAKQQEPVRYVNNIKYEKEARDALLRCIVGGLNEVADAAGGE
jgi:hypothetical protein